MVPGDLLRDIGGDDHEKAIRAISMIDVSKCSDEEIDILKDILAGFSKSSDISIRNRALSAQLAILSISTVGAKDETRKSVSAYTSAGNGRVDRVVHHNGPQRPIAREWPVRVILWFENFVAGEIPLWNMFFYYGVCAKIFFTYLDGYMTSVSGAATILLFALLYYTAFFIGFWRAADKYDGPRHWALLAKLWVIVGVCLSLVNVLLSMEALQKMSRIGVR